VKPATWSRIWGLSLEDSGGMKGLEEGEEVGGRGGRGGVG
jgi:hypothetical protein